MRLMDENKSKEVEEKLLNKNRVVSLFKFIGELNKLKQKVVLNISEHPWHCFINNIPDDPDNIQIYYRDRLDGDEEENATDILLKVHKPEFHSCPKPDDSFSEWLVDGWDSYENEPSISPFFDRPLQDINLSEEELQAKKDRINLENNTYKELFEDDEIRVAEFDSWIEKRNSWVRQQILINKTRDFFSQLYKVTLDLERDSETLELIVADGFLRDRKNSKIDHPILTRRVRISHDAKENTIYVKDVDVQTEMYTALFQNMDDVNLTAVNHLVEDLQNNDYHPLDRKDLPIFYEQLVHQLSSEGIYSCSEIPDNWQSKERILIYRNPCYILRKRVDGTLKAIEQIVSNVDSTGDFPAPIKDIVSGGKIDIPEESNEKSIEEQLAEVGGESIDILLSKEANREQLEIARRIEQYNAVLVQGPPGTGKTHTIANLMGHFLAQGKSVLVTSHTQKALRVLKDKLEPGIRNLCVSVIDDSNLDMEKSIDGITAYMSDHTSSEVRKSMESLRQTRKYIIDQLATVRKKMYLAINQETESIVYDGKSISPSRAATFVKDNKEKLSYIPGMVRAYEPLPLTFSQLADLYRSNDLISIEEEQELEADLPKPYDLIDPDEFEKDCNIMQSLYENINQIVQDNKWKYNDSLSEGLGLTCDFGDLNLNFENFEDVEKLKQYIGSFPYIESWMKQCAVDGKKGGMHKERWLRLIKQIQETCKLSEDLVAEKFGKKVEILTDNPNFYTAINQLYEKFNQNGKIGKLALLFNKQLEIALNGVTINGIHPQNAVDCKLVLDLLELAKMRQQCSAYWDDLIAKYNSKSFNTLDEEEPENVAMHYIPLIKKYLNWFDDEFATLKSYMENAGFSANLIFDFKPSDSELDMTEKVLKTVQTTLPDLCTVFEDAKWYDGLTKTFQQNGQILQSGKRKNSEECQRLYNAIKHHNPSAYRMSYELLQKTYAKTSLLSNREEYLKKLSAVAPQWADAIRNREGIHGSTSVPKDIEDAWLWKQYNKIIEDIVKVPFSDLQKQSLQLSKEYRKITAEYAEKCAWYHLLLQTEADIDMKQALNGWKLTVKKIGKGTGKNAPLYRAQARKLMAKCQNAVPAWIMTINKALESLNPIKNSFDVIIIDEASQSDISSLAILYMGKKLIIVGDDKQVSPMAVGVQTDKINAINQLYIAGKIPNSHLYDAKTSIYDIASTTFQPLMLREHFRCVPDIIRYCNRYFYDLKIKPLRDGSDSNLLPAVVNYRVENGWRVGKTNPNEAKTIVALLKSCIEQPEYAGKTFGIISLLGDEQVKIIQGELYKHIDSKTVEDLKIMCGNASNFQGDERDVVFLSLVDCANRKGPVPKFGDGPDNSYRKRFNVAVSRAKDQLWVVDSLDPVNDLKPDDIRKNLIGFSLDPKSILNEMEEIEKKSESPFEEAVALYLTKKKYHLVQQWKVGAYRLDMVVICNGKKIAIECDGERFHSGAEKIREDMERQTILERLGWKFIRIRGSEYYRNPDKTMEHVLTLLSENGIEPENEIIPKKDLSETELLRRVKQRALEILREEKFEMDQSATIASALNPKML